MKADISRKLRLLAVVCFAIIVLAVSLVAINMSQSTEGFGKGQSDESQEQVEEISTEVVSGSTDVEEEDFEGYTSGYDGPLSFNVSPSKSDEHEVEIKPDEVTPELTVVNDNWNVGACVLHEVTEATLKKDTITDGYAFYNWLNNDELVPTYLYIQDPTEAQSAMLLYNNLKIEQWRTDNGMSIGDETELTTPIGNGKVFRYESEADGKHFVSYVEMKNGKLCTIIMNGEFEYSSAVRVINDIYSNGITVILPTEEVQTEEESTLE